MLDYSCNKIVFTSANRQHYWNDNTNIVVFAGCYGKISKRSNLSIQHWENTS